MKVSVVCVHGIYRIVHGYDSGHDVITPDSLMNGYNNSVIVLTLWTCAKQIYWI